MSVAVSYGLNSTVLLWLITYSKLICYVPIFFQKKKTNFSSAHKTQKKNVATFWNVKLVLQVTHLQVWTDDLKVLIIHIIFLWYHLVDVSTYFSIFK